MDLELSVDDEELWRQQLLRSISQFYFIHIFTFILSFSSSSALALLRFWMDVAVGSTLTDVVDLNSDLGAASGAIS